MKFHTPYIICALLAVACTKNKGVDTMAKQNNALARVGDTYLNMDDVFSMLGDKFDKKDSAELVNGYINNWIRDEAMFAYANTKLNKNQKNKDDLLHRYYMDLLIYELQKAHLDTAVSDSVAQEEIENYYNTYPSNFDLKQNIVKLNFFKIPKHVVKMDELWAKYRENTAKNTKLIKNVVKIAGGNYFLNDSSWLSFSDVQKEIPLITYNQESFLNNNKWIRTRDNNFEYFVHIMEFKIKNSSSPLSFEQENIKNAIINQRKVALLQQLEAKVVRELYKNKQIIKF